MTLTGCPQPPKPPDPPALYAFKLANGAITTCGQVMKALGDHEPPIGGGEGSFRLYFPVSADVLGTTNNEVKACSHESDHTGVYYLSAATWLNNGQSIQSVVNLDVTKTLSSGKAIKFHVAQDAGGASLAQVSLSRKTDPNYGSAWVLSSPSAPLTKVTPNNPSHWTVTSVPGVANATVRLLRIEVEGDGTAPPAIIELGSLLGTKVGQSAYRICHTHDDGDPNTPIDAATLAKDKCDPLANPYVNQVVNKPFPSELLVK